MASRFPALLLSFFLLAGSVSAFAAPGELNAVERHCGAPGAESKENSPINGQLQRTLIYNNALYLHFEPVQGGWTFTTAWNGHLPMTRSEVEHRLPCFQTAMQEAAAQGESAMDPAIAQQSSHSLPNEGTFGIPHFWLIVILAITLIVFLILPSARQRQLQAQLEKPVNRIYRKPNLDEYPAYVPPVRRMGHVEVVNRQTGEVLDEYPSYVQPVRQMEHVELVNQETGEVVETERPLFREV